MGHLKKATVWVLLATIVLTLLGVAGLVITLEKATDVPEQSKPALTTVELNEFKEVVFELAPDQQVVTKVTQWRDTRIVDVTVGDDFIRLNQTQQEEMAISMRDALSKICSCSPYLRFNTEDGQRIVHIGRKQPQFR